MPAPAGSAAAHGALSSVLAAGLSCRAALAKTVCGAAQHCGYQAPLWTRAATGRASIHRFVLRPSCTSRSTSSGSPVTGSGPARGGSGGEAGTGCCTNGFLAALFGGRPSMASRCSTPSYASDGAPAERGRASLCAVGHCAGSAAACWRAGFGAGESPMRGGSTWSMRRCREAGLAVFEAGFEGGSMEGGPRRGGAVGDEVVAGGRARDGAVLGRMWPRAGACDGRGRGSSEAGVGGSRTLADFAALVDTKTSASTLNAEDRATAATAVRVKPETPSVPAGSSSTELAGISCVKRGL